MRCETKVTSSMSSAVFKLGHVRRELMFEIIINLHVHVHVHRQ